MPPGRAPGWSGGRRADIAANRLSPRQLFPRISAQNRRAEVASSHQSGGYPEVPPYPWRPKGGLEWKRVRECRGFSKAETSPDGLCHGSSRNTSGECCGEAVRASGSASIVRTIAGISKPLVPRRDASLTEVGINGQQLVAASMPARPSVPELGSRFVWRRSARTQSCARP